MNELTKYANLYETDKGTLFHHQHNFSTVYDAIFKPIRENVRVLFEIGILDGSSLRMWRDYFYNAEIYGIDINKDSLFKDERITSFIADQASSDDLNRVLKEIGSIPDIIIDDGCHFQREQLVSLGHLFPKLKSGGWYVIEDLHSSLHKVCSDDYLGSTLEVLRNYSQTKRFQSNFIPKEQCEYIEKNILNCFLFEIPNAKWEELYREKALNVEEELDSSITCLIQKR